MPKNACRFYPYEKKWKVLSVKESLCNFNSTKENGLETNYFKNFTPSWNLDPFSRSEISSWVKSQNQSKFQNLYLINLILSINLIILI